MYTPPHVGFYKLEIYASRVPKTKGKINLPLVATFMLEVCLQRLLRIHLKHDSRCGWKVTERKEAKSLRSRTAAAPKRWLLSMGRRGDCPGFSSYPLRSQTLLVTNFSSVLRRKARPGDDAGKLFNIRGRRSAGDQQRQRRDSNGSRRFSIVPESIVSDEEGRYWINNKPVSYLNNLSSEHVNCLTVDGENLFSMQYLTTPLNVFPVLSVLGR